jgi:hypothetical protein
MAFMQKVQLKRLMLQQSPREDFGVAQALHCMAFGIANTKEHVCLRF